MKFGCRGWWRRFRHAVPPCQADDEEAIASVDHGMLSLVFVDVEADLAEKFVVKDTLCAGTQRFDWHLRGSGQGGWRRVGGCVLPAVCGVGCSTGHCNLGRAVDTRGRSPRIDLDLDALCDQEFVEGDAPSDDDENDIVC